MAALVAKSRGDTLWAFVKGRLGIRVNGNCGNLLRKKSECWPIQYSNMKKIYLIGAENPANLRFCNDFRRFIWERRNFREFLRLAEKFNAFSTLILADISLCSWPQFRAGCLFSRKKSSWNGKEDPPVLVHTCQRPHRRLVPDKVQSRIRWSWLLRHESFLELLLG
jgi:hypothetical protein